VKAWPVTQHGEPEQVLELADIPRPAPGPGQILVRVLAAAANFPDVMLCRGTYQVKVPLPFTLGVELCGEVIEVGDGVTCFAVGDRVIGDTALPHGAFAEYALMDASAALPAPRALDDAEAAIQLGKAAGARVIGVVGGPQKAAVAKEAGADIVIDRSEEDFVSVVKEVTGGKGADVVFNPVGGDVSTSRPSALPSRAAFSWSASRAATSRRPR
jgi:NADPH2:quinone reductase